MTGLIKPGAVSIPAAASILTLGHRGAIEPLQIRDLYILVALHAFCVSGGSTLSPVELSGRRAVEIADATLAARDGQSPSPANPSGPPEGASD